jgi:glycosyltransferase involved in cell wall biosynthesis
MLAGGVVEARVIPNGIDLSVFTPRDRRAARAEARLPQDARILLFAASGIRNNIWKDYHTMRSAVEILGKKLHGQNVLFVAVGESAPPERIGAAEIRFVPFQSDPQAVARYYQAADFYVHAARADTFPNTVLEALACGAPVVATAVGGIPEQVRALNVGGAGAGSLADDAFPCGNGSAENATGLLTPPGDPQALAAGIEHLLADENLRRRLGENAAADARQRFDLNRQVDDYLNWYRKLLKTVPDMERESGPVRDHVLASA